MGRGCMWCEKEDDLYEIDAGHVFCSEKCESDYYQDREKRMKIGKPPLLLERRLGKKATDEEINHIACEMSQQDWSDLRFKEVYRKAFIDGAKYFNT